MPSDTVNRPSSAPTKSSIKVSKALESTITDIRNSEPTTGLNLSRSSSPRQETLKRSQENGVTAPEKELSHSRSSTGTPFSV